MALRYGPTRRLLVVVPILAATGRLLLREILLEVRVVNGLLRGNASRRIVHQHHLEQVQALVIKVAAKRQLPVALPLGER